MASVLAQWPGDVAMMEPMIMPFPMDTEELKMPAEMFEQNVTAHNVTLSGAFKGVTERDVDVQVSGDEMAVHVSNHDGQGGEGETMKMPREIVPDKVDMKVQNGEVTILATMVDPVPGEDTKDVSQKHEIRHSTIHAQTER